MLLVVCRPEIAVKPAVSAVLLQKNFTDTGTYFSVVNTGKRGKGGYACSYCSTVTSQCYGCRDLLKCFEYRVVRKWRFSLQLMQYCYFTVL